MKSTKRAVRRHHRERMIQRALRSCVLGWEEDREIRRERALGWYNNLAKCSCWMCGNPRKYEGRITVQERRQLQAAQDDMELA
jgi:hypothetical protein